MLDPFVITMIYWLVIYLPTPLKIWVHTTYPSDLHGISRINPRKKLGWTNPLSQFVGSSPPSTSHRVRLNAAVVHLPWLQCQDEKDVYWLVVSRHCGSHLHGTPFALCSDDAQETFHDVWCHIVSTLQRSWSSHLSVLHFALHFASTQLLLGLWSRRRRPMPRCLSTLAPPWAWLEHLSHSAAPKMGVLPVIIHFRLGFSFVKHPAMVVPAISGNHHITTFIPSHYDPLRITDSRSQL